jgi:hypothetical protein
MFCIIRIPQYKLANCSSVERPDNIFGPFNDEAAAVVYLKNMPERAIQSKDESRVWFADSPMSDTRYIFEIRPLTYQGK